MAGLEKFHCTTFIVFFLISIHLCLINFYCALGNDKIHRLTSRGRYELRVDIGDWNGNNWYALYKLFEVGNEDSKYQLIIGKYTGNAGIFITKR